LCAVAAYGVVLVVLVGATSAQTPDPDIPDGDPCCGHPDSWGEVALGFIWTLALVALVGAVLALAAALLARGIRRRRLPLRALVFVSALTPLLAALTMAVAVAVPP